MGHFGGEETVHSENEKVASRHKTDQGAGGALVERALARNDSVLGSNPGRQVRATHIQGRSTFAKWRPKPSRTGQRI